MTPGGLDDAMAQKSRQLELPLEEGTGATLPAAPIPIRAGSMRTARHRGQAQSTISCECNAIHRRIGRGVDGVHSSWYGSTPHAGTSVPAV